MDIPDRSGPADALRLAMADPGWAELLFDQLADVVFFVKDAAGRYRVVNATLLRRCGFRHKSELVGRTAMEVFPAELGAGYAAQDRLVLATGLAVSDRLERHIYPNRSAGWCLTHKLPLRDPAGAIVGLAGISRDLRMPDQGDPVYRRVARAVEQLQTRCAEPLRIDDLARVAGLSTAQFERHIARIFGLTPKQLLIKARVEAAMARLMEPGTVADVAYACGYADHSAFSRQFRAVVGVSPSEYRALGTAGGAQTQRRKDAEGELIAR